MSLSPGPSLCGTTIVMGVTRVPWKRASVAPTAASITMSSETARREAVRRMPATTSAGIVVNTVTDSLFHVLRLVMGSSVGASLDALWPPMARAMRASVTARALGSGGSGAGTGPPPAAASSWATKWARSARRGSRQ